MNHIYDYMNTVGDCKYEQKYITDSAVDLCGRCDNLQHVGGVDRDVGYLEVVHVALCPHDQFTGWDGLTTGTARSTVPK